MQASNLLAAAALIAFCGAILLVIP